MRTILFGLTAAILAGHALAQAPAPSHETQAREQLRRDRKAFQD
ncbi:hypothetical protein [Paludisphaera rhizosphaerae]|nr:hypothetical protein [Paludisphaera rhizosphaerae]